ncbi:hypothetical protein RFI_31175 [Reticulomyxa filosa]|uniref:Uncharacterized protein n=1 Tax=Reticulomyxa filosa TaxID=46433 RepID=X6LXX9_RETFI|nr:hypothetical protein RFI_31175 [Reticulomyxa filosa]|eukprot:ETO06221.1 hypothetical protein RFI_31175 [Reticulomyxa filosa]
MACNPAITQIRNRECISPTSKRRKKKIFKITSSTKHKEKTTLFEGILIYLMFGMKEIGTGREKRTRKSKLREEEKKEKILLVNYFLKYDISNESCKKDEHTKRREEIM